MFCNTSVWGFLLFLFYYLFCVIFISVLGVFYHVSTFFKPGINKHAIDNIDSINRTNFDWVHATKGNVSFHLPFLQLSVWNKSLDYIQVTKQIMINSYICEYVESTDHIITYTPEAIVKTWQQNHRYFHHSN